MSGASNIGYKTQFDKALSTLENLRGEGSRLEADL